MVGKSQWIMGRPLDGAYRAEVTGSVKPKAVVGKPQTSLCRHPKRSVKPKGKTWMRRPCRPVGSANRRRVLVHHRRRVPDGLDQSAHAMPSSVETGENLGFTDRPPGVRHPRLGPLARGPGPLLPPPPGGLCACPVFLVARRPRAGPSPGRAVRRPRPVVPAPGVPPPPPPTWPPRRAWPVRHCGAGIRQLGALPPTPSGVRRCGRSPGVPAPACG